MPRRDSGKICGEGRDHAVDVGDAGAQPDQREHVGAAVDERRPEALEERQAAPENDGGGENEFEPGENRTPGVATSVAVGDVESAHESAWPEHAAHGDREQRRGQDDADPEAAGHVAQFRILFVLAVTVRGSSAMPQIGHDRARSARSPDAWGRCIRCASRASGTSGSRAMPQEGQAPGLISCTSGHMGQT